MKCYEHPKKNAVGICALCKRGVCEESAAYLGWSQLCKPHARVYKILIIAIIVGFLGIYSIAFLR